MKLTSMGTQIFVLPEYSTCYLTHYQLHVVTELLNMSLKYHDSKHMVLQYRSIRQFLINSWCLFMGAHI